MSLESQVNIDLLPAQVKYQLLNFDETSNASMETADSLANEVDQNSVRSTGQELQDGPIYSYELVQEVEIDYTRPVVILGKDTNMYTLAYLHINVLTLHGTHLYFRPAKRPHQ